MTQLSATARGIPELLEGLAKLDPERNAQVLERAYASMGQSLVAGIQAQMSGPRPAKLDVVSGELRRSVTFDVRGKTLEAGVPDTKHWFQLHEDGSPGGRRQKRRKTLTRGYPARPAVQPAVDLFIASGEAEEALLEAWEGQLR